MFSGVHRHGGRLVEEFRQLRNSAPYLLQIFHPSLLLITLFKYIE
jgi:hypothetical protein